MNEFGDPVFLNEKKGTDLKISYVAFFDHIVEFSCHCWDSIAGKSKMAARGRDLRRA